MLFTSTIMNVQVNPLVSKIFDSAYKKSTAITFDEITFEDKPSTIHPNDVDLSTHITTKYKIRSAGIISSPMDTVTEKEMALAIAKMGGVGIIHRNMSSDEQCQMIKWVRNKIHYGGMIEKPISYKANNTVSDVELDIKRNGWTFTNFPILDDNGSLLGMVSRNEMDFTEMGDPLLKDIMIPYNKLIVTHEINKELAYKIMKEHKVKKLPVIDENNKFLGIYAWKDIKSDEPNKDLFSLDEDGHFLVGAAVGCGESEKERVKKLADSNCKIIVIDTSHGANTQVIDMLIWIKTQYPNVEVIIGNIASYDSCKFIIDECQKKGVMPNAIRVGVSPGCFAADTRILMANGTYKNISDIACGEYVINRYGEPVKVMRVINTGIRNTFKVRTNNWYGETIVTRDHQYWIGDISSSLAKGNKKTGKVELLDRQIKTAAYGKTYKWQRIGSVNTSNMVLLMPNTINFKIPPGFKFDLSVFCKRGTITDTTITTNGTGSVTFNRYIKSGYDLGYIFGTYLGDGNTQIIKDKTTNCESAASHWSFGLDEQDIGNKLIKCITNVLNYNATSINKDGKVLYITVYNKCFSKLLYACGKKTKKNLPPQLMVSDKEYLQGIIDGLIDSDGHVTKRGYLHFTNTSTYLIELFNICCMILGKSFSNCKKEKSAGNLKNCNPDNLKQPYRAHIHTGNRFTQDYVYSEILETQNNQAVDVWDLEVDCQTHSFIANNSIVHNSICTTRRVTGHGMPQLTAIYQVWKALNDMNATYIPIIADGGIKYSGDIVKAFAVGASCVMLGGIFAGCDEACSKDVTLNGQKYKTVRGMGSKEAMQERDGSRMRYLNTTGGKQQSLTKNQQIKIVPEGVSGVVKHRGTVEKVITELTGGTRSGFAHSGAKNIHEFRQNCKLWLQSTVGINEGNPHSLEKIIDQ